MAFYCFHIFKDNIGKCWTNVYVFPEHRRTSIQEWQKSLLNNQNEKIEIEDLGSDICYVNKRLKHLDGNLSKEELKQYFYDFNEDDISIDDWNDIYQHYVEFFHF